MNVNTANIKTGFLVLLSILFIAACGGGGGGGGGGGPTSAPSSAPALSIGFGVKQAVAFQGLRAIRREH